MAASDRAPQLPADPLWYKDAIVYELHVRAFADSDGDGIGDFAGLASKLDYLQDLGVTALWLLPFYPSPLKDDGYDIADYSDVNPAYGKLSDVKHLLREAHARGLRVITEMVLNHTSDQHPWFQRARRAKAGSAWRNWYVWSDTPDRYRDARIIFKDFETSNWSWDPVAGAYYWHRFYAHQPDLNFANGSVQEAVLSAVDYWLKLGVDGLRLDAVPYLYEQEGTSCENLPATHQFLKHLRHHIDEHFAGRMLLAEANQWPEDAIAYFGAGDECHTAFHFPLMPRLFMAIQMEDRFPIIDIVEQTPSIPENCQWMLFLRNHDELTLEMVTDEERDYMYRVYAHDRQARINLGIRRRLAPLLGNNRRKIELMNGLLFSLPGTPVIYYGDEIGMGDNIYLGDRDAVRTPMQWSADRNAGFSRANPQKLYLPTIIDPEYHFESVNVETQYNNPESLLWWMKRLIYLRQLYPSFGRGTIEFLAPDNPKVLAFIRRYEQESVLVVANLSRFVQFAELDLSAYEGARPIELLGRSKFPLVGKLPYLLTLGPHALYWFELRRAAAEAPVAVRSRPERHFTLATAWDEVFYGKARASLAEEIRSRLPGWSWFVGKERTIQSVTIREAIPLGAADAAKPYLALLRVEYIEGEPEDYALPLDFATGDEADQLITHFPHAVVAHLRIRESGQEGALFDAVHNPRFMADLLDAILRRRRFKGSAGEVFANGSGSRARSAPLTTLPAPALVHGTQGHSSVNYGDQLILKLFRRIEAGVNPDLEISRFLTERAHFDYTPKCAGALAYRRNRDEPMTLGVLHEFVRNERTAWQYTIDALGRYFEQVLSRPQIAAELAEPVPGASLLSLAEADYPPAVHDLLNVYLQSAELLGRRTAELHLALAAESDDPAFAPEPFTALYQRSIFQSMRRHAGHAFHLLRRRFNDIPEPARAQAQQVRDREKEVLAALQAILEPKSAAVRIRCHGDFRLGHVLFTGKDFVIIDFGGMADRSLSERRLKRSPLRDVADMIRSLHYATCAAMFHQFSTVVTSAETTAVLNRGASFWYQWASAALLKSYRATAAGAPFLPKPRDELETFLHAFLLDRAVAELAHELVNRPNWVEVPVKGILDLLDAGRLLAERASHS
ncbi:MAG: maltose alpha-D-glucosyltransferase [Planctomycetia bacterium]|nr:maltose alpha-D-glucosyltransferase [Planctomycetia bacterium]